MIGEVQVMVPVRVMPRGSRNVVLGVVAGKLKIKTTAAPVDGRANRLVLQMIAREFGVAPSNVALIRGKTDRDKLFRVSMPSQLPGYVDQLAKGRRV
jgi:uncharacterized protein (TIGR00251 family)